MTVARASAWSLLLVAALSQVSTASERPADDKDAEQRRALRGLGEKDNRPPPGEELQEGDGEGEDDAKAGAGDQAPDRYTVQKGDTLWGICDTYFHDPWRWPKVWALNPDVTNPHWIFPGQTIRIGGITQSAPGSDPDAPATVSKASPEARRPSLPPPAPPGSGALREVGFVDTEELAFAGTISGSREEKIMLASGDQAYVEFARDKPLRMGQRYTIYQVDSDNPVKDPEAGKVLGYLVRIFGDVTIETVTDRTIATATLRDLVEPVERGYRVGPLFRQFKTIKPRPSTASGSARVVAAVQPNLLIAEGMLVVLNRGRRQGVEAGNRLRVLRQGDGYRPVMERWETNDDRFPADTVAEVIAVDVRDDASVAWVLGGNRPIRIGDIADLKKGY
jgi:hypothetical protein